ncbi:MAG: hypothetical protein EOP07_16235 [Proteobacteria bacterium]|nr:MAG: hypothetical protein EOP07_16235 [Pseudomonadota bacterium]
MKSIKKVAGAISLLLLASSLSSCGSDVPSQSSVIASDNYAIGDRVNVERILDARLRAQSPVYQLFYVHGTIPTGIALYDQSKVVDINSYQYISPDSGLIFSIGPINEDNPEKPFSEVIDSVTSAVVGTVTYTPATETSSRYFELTELCTGAYEDACTITFDPEALDYSIEYPAG